LHLPHRASAAPKTMRFFCPQDGQTTISPRSSIAVLIFLAPRSSLFAIRYSLFGAEDAESAEPAWRASTTIPVNRSMYVFGDATSSLLALAREPIRSRSSGDVTIVSIAATSA